MINYDLNNICFNSKQTRAQNIYHNFVVMKQSEYIP